MITISNNNKQEMNQPIAEVADLYMKHKYGRGGDIHDLLKMIKYININIDDINKVPYTPYWDFLMEVANNIDSGRWVMHPYNWKTYIMNANYVPMTEQAVEQRCNALRARCIQILESHGAPVDGLKNQRLLLIWIRNKNSFQDILSVMKTMVELNKLFSKKDIGNNHE